MNPHWIAAKDCFEIIEMPFYWRMKGSAEPDPLICPRMPIRLSIDSDYDFLRYVPTDNEWSALCDAYQRNENIGFVNPESGQLHTYGSSVNSFFLESIQRFSPHSIYEIGCGAGFTIQFLREHGWNPIGIDPSEYSRIWSERLGFPLINEFFAKETLNRPGDFIYCNDVFEHIQNVVEFSNLVFESLEDGGVFCFATTNSSECIASGDISMLEHQHVNMFTERSIHLILQAAGFGSVEIKSGSYGNTFHVVARKFDRGRETSVVPVSASCEKYFERALEKVARFKQLYEESRDLHCYVPLRCLPYLSTVGDFGHCPIYDSNPAWRGKYIDGYDQPLRSIDEIVYRSESQFFIGSLTFYNEIKKTLIEKGFPSSSIFGFKSCE